MITRDMMVLAHDPESLLIALPFWIVAACLGWAFGGINFNEITLRTDARYRIVWLFRNVTRWR